MGGKDVIHMKQLQNSNLQPVEVQKLLKQLADEQFSEDGSKNSAATPDVSSGKSKVLGTLKFVQIIMHLVNILYERTSSRLLYTPT